MENVALLRFAGTDQAEEAMRGLRRLHDADDVKLNAAVVVNRAGEGRSSSAR